MTGVARRAAGTFVRALIGLLTLASLAGFLDQLSWIFEPASFFRLQYAGALGLAAAGALLLRDFRFAGIAAVVAGLNLAVIAPWHGSGNPPASATAPTVRIVSFNVDVANRRFGALPRLIRRLHPDILGLTEVTPGWARVAAAASARVRVRRVLPQSDAYGIGLLSALRPTMVSAQRFPASGPLALIARFRIGGLPLTFVLVHAHTSFAGSIHVRELRALAEARPRLGRRLVICGDFNTVPWSAQFGEFAESTGLRDAFAGGWPAYSWPSWSPLLRVPLDHCLVSDGISVRGRRFGPSSGSDHFPLIVDLALIPFSH